MNNPRKAAARSQFGTGTSKSQMRASAAALGGPDNILPAGLRSIGYVTVERYYLSGISRGERAERFARAVAEDEAMAADLVAAKAEAKAAKAEARAAKSRLSVLEASIALAGDE